MRVAYDSSILPLEALRVLPDFDGPSFVSSVHWAPLQRPSWGSLSL
jgi:hypothetical protein